MNAPHQDGLPALAEFDEWQRNAPRELPERFSAVLRNALAARPLPVQAEPMDMALCESASLVLREGQLYRFRRVGDCEKCIKMSADSLESYGPPPDDLAAHPKAEPADRWQTMETAPKDGTNVLLVNRKGNMAVGLWLDSLSGSGWYLRGGSHGPDTFFNDHHGPTHWQPLPAAPSAKEPT